MERFQFWLFVGLALAFGLAIKAMNGVDPNASRMGAFGRFDGIFDEGRQIYAPGSGHTTKLFEKEEKEDAPETSEVAGLEPAKTETPKASPSATPAPKAADKKKEKKKKKKKTVKGKGEEPKPETKEEDDKKPEDNPGAGVGGDTGMNVAIGGLPAEPDDGMPKTAEEWKEYLIPTPDFEKVSKFIRLHQTGIVNKDVFYPVVTEMIEDPRPEMRQLGVTALGSTPSLTSFTMLTKVEATESPKSRIKAQSQIYLQAYMRLEYLRFLAKAMTMPENPTVNLKALSLFRLAVEKQKKFARRGGPSEQSTDPKRLPAAAQVARYLNPFRNLLQQLMLKNPDPNVRDSANDARTSLDEFLDTRSGTRAS